MAISILLEYHRKQKAISKFPFYDNRKLKAPGNLTPFHSQITDQ